ncbi:ribonuclease H [Trifolium pratense]|uniref:Ribonuclease H n=1 Tax=Trifolium pratense TaxID=57577 RepID=A0A2K3PRT5_TRIPR|nr:ribonuclease H [Trifolium pratense]
MVDHLVIPEDKHHLLQGKDVHVPNFRMEDKLVWKHTNNEFLCFRYAYLFQKPPLNKTSQHLFWDCAFAKNLWTWLAFTINIGIDTSSIEAVLNICNKSWSPQSIINLIDVIWFCRNKRRFDNKIISWKLASHLVISNTSLAGNHSAWSSFSDMHEFVILKAFSVVIHAPNAPRIKEVLWHPPIVS